MLHDYYSMVLLRPSKNQLYMTTIPWFFSDCLQLPPHPYELMIRFNNNTANHTCIYYWKWNFEYLEICSNQIWSTILDHFQIPNASLYVLYCLLYWPNEARCCLGLRPSRVTNKRPLLVHTACSAIIRLFWVSHEQQLPYIITVAILWHFYHILYIHR